MDGTLVDSIGAVEQAWGNVAKGECLHTCVLDLCKLQLTLSLNHRPAELKMDPQAVIDHTHGRRATDNLRDLKPELQGTPEPEMQPHVKEFEEKILASADEFHKEVRSRRQSMAEEIVSFFNAPHESLVHRVYQILIMTLHLLAPTENITKSFSTSFQSRI